MNTTTFRGKQRELLGDTQQGAFTFEDAALDSWRDDEIGALFSKGLFTRGTNIGSEPTISSADPVAIYYTMPTGFRRITKIQFVSATDETDIVGMSYGWDDLERPGYVYIPETSGYGGYKIRMFGEKEYSGVDDSSAKQELIDVILLGSVSRALLSEYMKRVEQRRSLTTRSGDAGPGDLVSGMALVERKYQKAIARALAIQSRTVMGF